MERTPTAFRERLDDELGRFLLRSFLSDEEEQIVRLLVDSPKKAAVLIDRTRIERSKFYVLSSNLGDRGIIRATSDGYELVSELVLKILEVSEQNREDSDNAA